MDALLTEPKALKKLGIKDFQHLPKSKVITLASMLDKMEPEVAKKAIEQFPNFSGTMKEILHDYKESLDKALQSNAESVKSFYDSSDSIIRSLQRELERDNQTFEERKYIIDKMMEVNQLKGDKDSENKNFLTTLATVGLTVVGVVAALLLSLLGGDYNIEIDDKNRKDDIDPFNDIHID